MGHLRLGVLPTGKRWTQVVELLATSGNVADLADATAYAAEAELETAKSDPALTYTVWLLTQLPIAARSPQFAARLGELGFDAGSDQSVLGLTAGFTTALDRQVSGSYKLTDFGDLARQAAVESLSSIVGAGMPSLFGSSADDLQLELARLGSKDRFAGLARDFFSRLTQKTLEYYISRELPNHVGPGKNFESIERQVAFRTALATHCREASLIVEQFAGGWYSKANYKGDITPSQAQGFADYSLRKLRDELRTRRGG